MNEDVFTVQNYIQEFDNLVEPHYLLPFGDIHEGNPNCHIELWQEWCDWAKTKKRAIFIGMGDYMEWFSDSERDGMNAVKLHQSSKKTLDDFAKDMCDKFFDRIRFMRGKLIGLMEGNHHYKFGCGMTSTQYLCQRLNCKYLGASAFTRITFSYSKAKNNGYGGWTSSVDVFSHHGKGASRLVGGSLNTVQQMAECANANIYLMGHDHKKSIGMSSKLELTHGSNGVHLRERKILYGRTGSFLKGYEPEKPSYVSKALLNPCDLGTIKIELTPKQQRRVVGKDIRSSRLVVDIHGSI